MNSSGGQLQLKIVSGKLTRDVETFGKMDPYVTCEYLGQKYKTIIHEDGGKNPVWNHTFDIPIGALSDDMHFFVKDNDIVGATEIGSAIIKASSFCINNGVRDWFTFNYQGEAIGQVLMESKFTAKGGSAPVVNAVSGQQQVPGMIGVAAMVGVPGQ